MFIDRIILIFIIIAYFLSPAILSWISSGGNAWYRPYLLWLGIILINYWLISKQRHPIDKDEA